MEELPNCKQLKTGGLQFSCLGHSMPPTTSLTWDNPKPRLLKEANLFSPSVSPAASPASSGTSSKQPFCHQVPLPNPKFRDSPYLVKLLCSYNLGVCTVCQDGWGRTVQMSTAVNSILNLSHLQELQSFREIFSLDLKPSAVENCISKDCYGNSSSSLIKIILHLVSNQKLLMNIRERMRKLIT